MKKIFRKIYHSSLFRYLTAFLLTIILLMACFLILALFACILYFIEYVIIALLMALICIVFICIVYMLQDKINKNDIKCN